MCNVTCIRVCKADPLILDIKLICSFVGETIGFTLSVSSFPGVLGVGLRLCGLHLILIYMSIVMKMGNYVIIL